MSSQVTVILPCAGKSARFPGLRPKFLLVNPSGNLMLQDAISRLDLREASLVITVLKEHEQKYRVSRIVKKVFSSKHPAHLCVLDSQTGSQSETVYHTLRKMRIRTPFLIKDADNVFRLDDIVEPFNYVTASHLAEVSMIDPKNKSYVLSDTSGLITAIEEKKIISSTFSIGGYYFLRPDGFMRSFERLSRDELTPGEMYISKLISHLMLTEGAKFRVKYGSEYLDLGTSREWLAYKSTIKTYFVDIDGILMKNSGEHTPPFWGTTPAISENVEVVRTLHERGNQIILTTSRRESYRQVTVRQLKKWKVPYHHLLMDMFHTQRVLINDFAGSNPYPSAIAVNIPRDSNELGKFLSL